MCFGSSVYIKNQDYTPYLVGIESALKDLGTDFRRIGDKESNALERISESLDIISGVGTPAMIILKRECKKIDEEITRRQGLIAEDWDEEIAELDREYQRKQKMYEDLCQEQRDKVFKEASLLTERDNGRDN